MFLRLHLIPAGDHGTDFVPGADQKDLEEVDGYESNDREGDDEMDRTRRLTPAKYVEQHGQGRVHRWRHGEPCQDHQRNESKDHSEVGDLLCGVVAFGFLPTGHMQFDVRPNIGGQVLQGEFVAAKRNVALNVAAGKRQDEISEPIEGKEPGKEEVIIAARSEIADAGQGHPTRKATTFAMAVDIGGAQETSRIEGEGADVCDADGPPVGGYPCFERNDCVIGIGAMLTPIEPGMSIENLEAAEQQNEDANMHNDTTIFEHIFQLKQLLLSVS